MTTARRAQRLLAVASAAALLSACQTTREQEAVIKPEIAHSYLADKPEALKPHFFVTLTQGKRNQVLNHMRLGLAALEMGDDALATSLLDDALDNIETVYADNPDAAKARGLFVKEGAKDFKGEPYERAMAYYYRGLLYLKAGDYDNARASFKGGLLQDTFAEEEQHRADFGLLAFLQAWASRCRGSTVTAQDDWAEFRAIDESFPLPGEKDNVLVLVETGSAPIKYPHAGSASSAKGKFLKIRRASATETARIPLPTRKGKKTEPLQAGLLGDVYRQASTRGGREFDSLLAGKVNFKEGAEFVGNAALAGAMVAASYSVSSDNNEQQQNAAAAAGILLMVGLIAKGVEAATEAEADARYWDNLPDRVHGVTISLPDGVTSLPVEFVAEDGTVVRTKEAPVWRAGACGLSWVRGYPATLHTPRAPYSAPEDTMMQPIEIPAVPAIQAKPDTAPPDAKS